MKIVSKNLLAGDITKSIRGAKVTKVSRSKKNGANSIVIRSDRGDFTIANVKGDVKISDFSAGGVFSKIRIGVVRNTINRNGNPCIKVEVRTSKGSIFLTGDFSSFVHAKAVFAGASGIKSGPLMRVSDAIYCSR